MLTWACWSMPISCKLRSAFAALLGYISVPARWGLDVLLVSELLECLLDEHELETTSADLPGVVNIMGFTTLRFKWVATSEHWESSLIIFGRISSLHARVHTPVSYGVISSSVVQMCWRSFASHCSSLLIIPDIWPLLSSGTFQDASHVDFIQKVHFPHRRVGNTT